jgi:DMSO/TMAO reductase YedYZ heme-binding membrane subunit
MFFGFFGFLIAALLLYIAYRCFAGGFERPQSEKFNGFGIFAIVLMLLLAVTYVSSLFS